MPSVPSSATVESTFFWFLQTPDRQVSPVTYRKWTPLCFSSLYGVGCDTSPRYNICQKRFSLTAFSRASLVAAMIRTLKLLSVLSPNERYRRSSMARSNIAIFPVRDCQFRPKIAHRLPPHGNNPSWCYCPPSWARHWDGRRMQKASSLVSKTQSTATHDLPKRLLYRAGDGRYALCL